jgi:hypothetical protein
MTSRRRSCALAIAPATMHARALVHLAKHQLSELGEDEVADDRDEADPPLGAVELDGVEDPFKPSTVVTRNVKARGEDQQVERFGSRACPS